MSNPHAALSLNASAMTRRLRAARLGIIRSYLLADGSALRIFAHGPAEARAIAAHLLQLGYDAAASADRVTATLPEPTAAEEAILAGGDREPLAEDFPPLSGELRTDELGNARYWTREELDAEEQAERLAFIAEDPNPRAAGWSSSPSWGDGRPEEEPTPAPQPERIYPATVGGGASIHGARLTQRPELPRGELGASEILCGAGRQGFTSVGYAFAPTIRHADGAPITCRRCLRSLETGAWSLASEEPTAEEALARLEEQLGSLPEADLPPDSEPRELLGTEARYLRPGDLICRRGTQSTDRQGNPTATVDWGAFDVDAGPEGARMVAAWTRIADQERGLSPIVTLPAGLRLLILRRLPGCDPADREALASLLPEPPALCGPAGGPWRGGSANGGHDWDLNVSWTCKRTAALYQLWGSRDDILRETQRLAQLRANAARLRSAPGGTEDRRAARQESKARGLADWILRATARYQARAALLLGDLPACGHAPADRRELSVEEALPACSC